MRSDKSPRIIVIGAGIGGLTTAAVLAKIGLDVTVLEAHVYPGGCAGTFYHQGYRFDAGATLAGGFYPGGPMDMLAQLLEIEHWSCRFAEPSMRVHLPSGYTIDRRGDYLRREEYRSIFGNSSDHFWGWQEETADLLWDLALQLPSWPPQTWQQLLSLGQSSYVWLRKRLPHQHLVRLVRDAFMPISAQLPENNELLDLFVDAQLLISAQTTSKYANSLFGAAALDLPRRGVVHLEGGIGTVAQKLTEALQFYGGRIHYRSEVTRIITEKEKVISIETKRGISYPADIVIANLTPWNIVSLLKEHGIRKLKNIHPQPQDGCGAFMVYVGLDDAIIPVNYPLHHQVVRGKPFGEGNTIFLSLSPEWDNLRAPHGQRAVTISTHTDLKPWWHLYAIDQMGYQSRKNIYTERILEAAEVALPGLRAAAKMILPGTPVTFQRFTRRHMGWVGGFPQTNLFKFWGPRLSHNLWMVGDSIFPGQSIAATALGGLRLAQNLLTEIGLTTIQLTNTNQRTMIRHKKNHKSRLAEPG